MFSSWLLPIWSNIALFRRVSRQMQYPVRVVTVGKLIEALNPERATSMRKTMIVRPPVRDPDLTNH